MKPRRKATINIFIKSFKVKLLRYGCYFWAWRDCFDIIADYSYFFWG